MRPHCRFPKKVLQLSFGIPEKLALFHYCSVLFVSGTSHLSDPLGQWISLHDIVINEILPFLKVRPTPCHLLILINTVQTECAFLREQKI